MTIRTQPTSLPARALPVLDRLLRSASPSGAEAGVLVALSGGPDSTALLRLAVMRRERGGGPVAAAHLNHLLRGDDSDADEAFCRGLCADLDVPLRVERLDPRGPAVARGAGLEEAARSVRRSFLLSVLDGRRDLAACATGHHRDDQIETLVLRFFRGAGPRGLRGIRPRSGRFVHPLLGIGRDEILAWLAEIGQPWRLDASNEAAGNLRARVRHELLPLARSIFGPGAGAAPLRLAATLRDDATELERQAARLLSAWRRRDGDDAPPVADLAALPRALAVRVLRRRLREVGGPVRPPSRARVARILDWLPRSRPGGATDLGEGWRVRRHRGRLLIEPAADEIAAPLPRLEARPATPEEIASRAPETGRWPFAAVGARLTCPREALRGAAVLRNWRPGDRIDPFGMAGHRKVADLLREAGVPAPARRSVLLVADDGGPLWIPGLVRAERTRLLPTTCDAVTLLIRQEKLDAAGTG